MSGRDDKPNFVWHRLATEETIISLGVTLLPRSCELPVIRRLLYERLLLHRRGFAANQRYRWPRCVADQNCFRPTPHHFSLFVPICIGTSIVSVALSLGLRENVRHVSLPSSRHTLAAVNGSP